MTLSAPAARLDGCAQATCGTDRSIAAPQVACFECGRPYLPGKTGRRFCSTDCSRVFNNRRAGRGAALYDLFMTWRYERGLSARLKVWRAMCRLAAQWRLEDVERRAGRASWAPAVEVLAGRPYLTGDRGRL